MGSNANVLPSLNHRILSISALGCLLVIGVVDVVIRPRTSSRLVEGLVDETAHAATALLLLAALDPQSVSHFGLPAVLGAVLIDADHVPMEFWDWDILTGRTGRPYPHSLAGCLAALLVVSRLPPRCRSVGGAVVAGIVAHLVRDLGTGGVPLLWPLTSEEVQTSYLAYSMLLGLALGFIMGRECWPNRTVTISLACKTRDLV